ncbi:MAG: tetratricopeptide repeat protein [Bacteroidota bacterium]
MNFSREKISSKLNIRYNGKKRSAAFYFVLLILSCNIIKASEIDSLKSLLKKDRHRNNPAVMNRLSSLLLESNPTRSLELAEKSLEILQNNRKGEKYAKAIFNAGNAYFKLGKYDKAHEQYNRAEKAFQHVNDTMGLANTYFRKALLHKNQKKYPIARSLFEKANYCFEAVQDSSGIALVFHHMGNLAWETGNYDEATKLYHRSKNIKITLKDTAGIAASLSNIGLVYKDISQFDSSLYYYQRSLNLHSSISDTFLLARTFHYIANVYLKMGNYHDALENYQKAISYHILTGHEPEIIPLLINMGDVMESQGNTDSSLLLYGEALELAARNLNRIQEIRALNRQAKTFVKIQEYSNALRSYLKALKIALEQENLTLAATTRANIAQLYMNLGSYEFAMKYFKESINNYRESDDVKKLAFNLVLLGNACQQNGEPRKALEHYREALAYNESIGDPREIAMTLKNIGVVETKLNSSKNARNSLNKAIRIMESLNDSTRLAYLYNEMGNMYEKFGEDDSAFSYFNHAFKTAKSVKNDFIAGLCARKVADIHIARGDLTKGLELLEYSLQTGKTNGSLIMISNALKSISRYHELVGNYKEALINYHLHTKLNDSIQKVESTEKLLQLQVQHEMEIKNKELEEIQGVVMNLEQENIIRTLEISRQKTIGRFLFVTLALFTIAVYFVYNRYKIKKKSEAELQKINSTKDKFFSIIAHDLKNPLSALMGFTEHVHRNSNQLSIEEMLEINSLIRESSKNLNELLQNLLNWARAQTGRIQYNPEIFDISEITGKTIILLRQIANDKKIEIKNNIASTNVCGDKNMISLIIRNLLSNALKFTHEGGKITIESVKNNNYLYVKIIDNGVGMDKETLDKLFKINESVSTRGTGNEEGTGLGLILCREFIEKNGGNIQVESSPGKGSVFTFNIPLEKN